MFKAKKDFEEHTSRKSLHKIKHEKKDAVTKSYRNGILIFSFYGPYKNLRNKSPI